MENDEKKQEPKESKRLIIILIAILAVNILEVITRIIKG